MSTGLGRRIALGGAVLVALRMSLKLIGLISTTILFRLLVPEDFGIVALAMLVVGFVEVFAEFGFDLSLLRSRDVSDADFNLVWTLNALRGLAVAVLLIVAAPFAARYMIEPRLEPVIRALALAPLLDGIQSVGPVDFARKMQFEREFRLRVSQKLASFFVTIGLALLLQDYWALVIGQVTSRLVGLALGYAMHPFRPRPTLDGWRKVMRFSLWMLSNSIVLYTGNQTDKVVVQRGFNASAVGIVRIAEEISALVMELVWPIERALQSGYLSVVDKPETLRRTVVDGISIVAAIGVPLALLIGIVAEPAVALLLGENGRPAVPLVQIYVLHGALRSCVCGIPPALLVLNRPDVSAKTTLFQVAVRLATLAATFNWLGIFAVPLSMVAGSAIGLMLLWHRSVSVVGLGALAFPAAVWRFVLAGAIMWGCGHIALVLLPTTSASLLKLGVAVPACAAAYVSSVLVLWRVAGRPDGPERRLLDIGRSWWTRRRLAAEQPAP